MSFIERFSDRVKDYAKHRPSYPTSALDLLSDHGLEPGATVIDVGSGTGILTQLMLNRNATVYAVEPNAPMREEAERSLSSNPGFHSIAATAEHIPLPDACANLVTAAQAFHWFEPEGTRREWQRLLKPRCWVALLWNVRRDSSPFARAYGGLADGFVDQADHPASRRMASPTNQIEAFFAPNSVMKQEFDNHQVLNLDGLRGRALSSSYWPRSGQAYDDSISRLEELFEEYQQNGTVRFDYLTEVYLGQLT